MPPKTRKEVKITNADGTKKPQAIEPILSSRHILVILFVILISTALAFDVALSIVKSKASPACGDGTFYDSCSLIKPFYCEAGNLIEKASVCGCPEGFRAFEGSDLCTSNYHTNPKEVSLKYILHGKESQINFTAYEGMAGYVSRIPRAISYQDGAEPLKADFKIKTINEEKQREFLLPLAAKIQGITKDKDDQARIAISIVQNIPYGFSDKKGPNENVNYSRYPYEVIYDNEGICGEKSVLLAFLLKEMGHETAIFYYPEENHEAVGIGCPVKESVENSGFCFVETTAPAILSDDSITYVGGIRLDSKPQIIKISNGKSIGKNFEEYEDAKLMKKIRDSWVPFETFRLNIFEKRYGLAEEYHLA